METAAPGPEPVRFSRRRFLQLAAGVGGAAALGLFGLVPRRAAAFDVRAFGAVGDGHAYDTGAVNHAIKAAVAAGGGTVDFPPGIYRCSTIRLKSRVELHLARGATILAAPPGGFDAAEPNPWSKYQDFGHCHFHNSLIWGEGLHDVAIRGPGLIWGKGLSRDVLALDGTPSDLTPGVADKVIALKNCRNVTLRGFSILGTGHFGVLATGVDDLVVDGLKIDTTRDGINLDSCWRAAVTNCVLNTPNDDSICLKASYALGNARGTRDVLIRNCFVTGAYRVGTLLDGRREALPAGHGRQGRIKLGTESDGGFANIRIEDCTLQDCLGLALESVDGGRMQDIAVSSVAMRDIGNAPLFVRLGSRLRAPPGTAVGTIDRVLIRHLQCEGFKMPAMICGIPGHPVRDVTLADVRLLQRGGELMEKPDIVPPEHADRYPETGMFGPLPAQLLYARHVDGLVLSEVAFDGVAAADGCPFIWAENLENYRFADVRLPPGSKSRRFFRHEASRVSPKKAG